MELSDRKGVVGSAIRAVGGPGPVGSPWPRQRPNCVQRVVSSHGRALSVEREDPVYVFTSRSACCEEKCLQEERADYSSKRPGGERADGTWNKKVKVQREEAVRVKVCFESRADNGY